MRSIVVVMLCVLVVSAPALAQAPATSPADYVLVTVVLKHDQSKNLDETARSRRSEVNRSIELAAWKAFRTEIYATYDFKEAAKAQRERAQKK